MLTLAVPAKSLYGRAGRLGCEGANAAEHKRDGKEFSSFSSEELEVQSLILSCSYLVAARSLSGPRR